jgi:hypothetical protein
MSPKPQPQSPRPQHITSQLEQLDKELQLILQLYTKYLLNGQRRFSIQLEHKLHVKTQEYLEEARRVERLRRGETPSLQDVKTVAFVATTTDDARREARYVGFPPPGLSPYMWWSTFQRDYRSPPQILSFPYYYMPHVSASRVSQGVSFQRYPQQQYYGPLFRGQEHVPMDSWKSVKPNPNPKPVWCVLLLLLLSSNLLTHTSQDIVRPTGVRSAVDVAEGSSGEA